MYKIFFTKSALKAIPKLKAAHLDDKAKKLVDILRENPYKMPPPYEKLTGDLSGAISRRINVQHRLVYQADDENKMVKIVSMWTHYEF